MEGGGAYVTCAGYLRGGSILQRFQYHRHYSSNGTMKYDELERIWKEAVMA
jgi:hypothetical protein